MLIISKVHGLGAAGLVGSTSRAVKIKFCQCKQRMDTLAFWSSVKAKNVFYLIFKCLFFLESKVFFSLELVLISQDTANEL